VIQEGAGRGKDHCGSACSSSGPRWLEEDSGKSADECPLQEQRERALPVTEYEERSNEDDEMQVEAADRRRAGGHIAVRGSVGGPEREPPCRSADGEEGDREARLLTVEVAGAVEVVEDEREAGEAARGRVHRDLRADP